MTLRPLPLNDPAIAVHGALDVERSSDAIRLRRLPAWTRARSPEPAFELMAGMTSGVRLAFTTDATTIEIEVLTTGLEFVPEPRRPLVVDLHIDGTLAARRHLTGGRTIVLDGPAVRFAPGESDLTRFEDLADGMKAVELWLPHAGLTEVRALRLSPGAVIQPNRAPRPLWAHYGSSISHGMEADGPSETWPAVASQRLGLDLLNLGFAGQCHVDGFVARTLRDLSPDVISLKLGANVVAGDTMRRRVFAEAVHSFLDTVRDGGATIPILVISPIYCGFLETHPGPVIRRPGPVYERLERPDSLADGAVSLSAVRDILSDLVDQRRKRGDPHLHYLDGRTLLGEAEAAGLADHLHPDPDAHRRMGAQFAAMAETHHWLAGRDTPNQH